MEKDLFNAFGVILISPKSIGVTMTGIRKGVAVTRPVVAANSAPLPGLDPKRTYQYTFGAWLEPGQKPVLTVHELGKHKTYTDPENYPEVGAVIAAAAKLVLEA